MNKTEHQVLFSSTKFSSVRRLNHWAKVMNFLLSSGKSYFQRKSVMHVRTPTCSHLVSEQEGRLPGTLSYR